MGHQIEWLDNSIVYLETSTPTETGIRVVLKDGRVFEIDLVEPITSNERWKSHKLEGIYRAVSYKPWGLIPHPESKWGKQVFELLNGDSEETPDFDWNDWILMTLAGGELNKQHGIDVQSICGFARFEVNPEYIRTVGMRAFHESQLQQDELHSQIQGEVIRQGEKTRKHTGEMGHSLREKMKGPIKLAEKMIPFLDKQKEAEYDESKAPGGKARGSQRREQKACDKHASKLLDRIPSCIKNRRKILPNVDLIKIAEELAISLTSGQRLSPWMEKEIKKTPKAKRESMKKTFRKWIHEASTILDSPSD